MGFVFMGKEKMLKKKKISGESKKHLKKIDDTLSLVTFIQLFLLFL